MSPQVTSSQGLCGLGRQPLTVLLSNQGPASSWSSRCSCSFSSMTMSRKPMCAWHFSRCCPTLIYSWGTTERCKNGRLSCVWFWLWFQPHFSGWLYSRRVKSKDSFLNGLLFSHCKVVNSLFNQISKRQRALLCSKLPKGLAMICKT